MRLKSGLATWEYLLYSLIGITFFLLVWSAASYFDVIPSFFLPSPYEVLKALITLMQSGELFQDIFVSIYRIMLGVWSAAIVALPLGITLALSCRLEAVFEPLIAFVRYIPPSAFIPLSIIWFGIGELQKIIILFLGVAPYLTLMIYDVVMNMPPIYLESALTMGFKSRDLIFRVILPFIMPRVWESLRVMTGAAWTYVIIAEIVGATSGLGFLMIESQRFLRTDQIFAVVICIGILGMTTDYLFKWTYKLFFPWTLKSHA